jgi:hypothetical protein
MNPLFFERVARQGAGPMNPLFDFFAGGPAPMEPNLLEYQQGKEMEPGQTRRPNVIPLTFDAQTGRPMLAMPKAVDFLTGGTPSAIGSRLAPVAAAVGEVATGTGPVKLFHGSPKHDLTELRPSERGPLGPGAYLTPNEGVAKRYAGPEGKLYEKVVEEDDYFQGMRSSVDDNANPYQTWRDQTKRLVDAAEPENKAAVSALMEKMDYSDGYPFYARLKGMLGSDEKAQDLIRKAGYKGLTGNVDGPEWVNFDPVTLGAKLPAGQAASLTQELTKRGGLGGLGGKGPIRAYHGSPHDFDRFDLSKIGTGEGAQAYGHGLYFAENEGVARSYRDVLAAQQNAMARAGGKTPDSAHIAAIKSFKEYGYSPEATFEGMKKAYKGITDEQIEAALREVNTGGKGRMYEVAIHADPERFLDWAKPVKAQPKAVQEAVYDLAPHLSSLEKPTGKSAYEIIGRNHPGEGARDVLASEALRERGVPGLQYLDQGSRVKDAGTKNYVTFSDNIVEILRKYGLVGAAGGLGGLGGMRPQAAPQT